MSGLEEGCATLVAFIGVTSSMNPLVLKKWFDAVKGFPKFIVFIEFLPSLGLLLSIEENRNTKGSVTSIDAPPSKLRVGKRHFCS